MPKNVLWVFVIFLVISSCKNDKEEDASLYFENKTIVERSDDCVLESYSCSIISLEFISASGPEEISEKINRVLEQHLIHIVSTEGDPNVSSLQELAENFITNQKNSALDFDEEIPWKAYINTSIFDHTSQLVSIGVDAEISTGGAHGYSSHTFLNFDPETGEELSHSEIFKEGFKAYTEKVFREKQGIPTGENINSTGFWFENNEFELPENIGFDPSNVILVYNSYEIDSYADGDLYMEIPREEVKHFLKID